MNKMTGWWRRLSRRTLMVAGGVIVLLIISAAVVWALMFDLTFVGAVEQIDEAVYRSYNPATATGSGTFDSFVRISANTEVVQGYNTDGRPLQYDENTSPSFTRSYRLSNVPIVSDPDYPGIYREFQLDINQTSGNAIYSLDEVEVYLTTDPNLLGYPFDGSADKVYELDKVGVDETGDNWVRLDYLLAAGSGKRDMILRIPNANFLASELGADPNCSFAGEPPAGESCNTYVVLYSKFGENLLNDDGYEEWGVELYDLATKSGYKWHDLNADGIWDAGEPGLEGWIIYVDVNDNGVRDLGEPYDVTDADGRYEITNIVAGNYKVREEAPPDETGWNCSFPTTSDQYGCYDEHLFEPGGSYGDNNFGNWLPNASIDLEKFVSVDNQASWQDADNPTGPYAEAGSDVYFRFVVTNTGNVDLSNIDLTDTDFDLSACSLTDPLPAGDSFECVVGPFAANVGQHTDTGTATGDYETTTFSDDDDAHYLGVDASITIEPDATNEVGDPHTFTITVSAVGTTPTAWDITPMVNPVPDSQSDTCDNPQVSGTTATCSVTITDADPGQFTASAQADVTFDSLVVSVETDGQGDNSGAATKTYVDAYIQLTPFDAVNEVGDAHTITATVQVDDGSGAWTDAPDGTLVTFSLPTNTAGATFVSGNTCTTTNGNCSVQINADSPGEIEIHAATDVSVGGLVLSRETDGTGSNSGDAQKTYVDAYIRLTPLEAINLVGDPHTITATVQVDDGSGAWTDAPDGTLVTFTLPTNEADAVFVGDSTCETVEGECSVQINANSPGQVAIHAATDVSVGGLVLHRETDGTGDNSGDGSKLYVEAGIDLEKFVSVDNQASWQDADNPTGPYAEAGSDVYFRFVFTNTADVDLSNIVLTDTDFATEIGEQCDVPTTLPAGDSFECIIGPFDAIAGQHENTGTVTGEYEGQTYGDQDDAHYFGREPAYTFQKYVNGEDADTREEAVDVKESDTLTFTYTLTNTGNIPITWTGLDDDVFGNLTTHCELPIELDVGEAATCVYTSTAGFTEEEQEGKRNIGTASVEGLDDQEDPAWYRVTEPTPVELLYFRAQWAGSAIRLEWASAAEVNVSHFYIYRAESSRFGAADRIEFVNAEGSGSTYQALDEDVEPGTMYWYWLQSVDYDGSTQLEGPVQPSIANSLPGGGEFRIFLPLARHGF